MNTQDVLNRGYNLMAVSIVGLAGFAFLPEVFLENDIPDKIDDSILFILALIGIGWYQSSNNRYKRSRIPLVLMLLALAAKIGALVVEFGDAASVGDDFGALILFVLASGLVTYQYAKNKKILSTAL